MGTKYIFNIMTMIMKKERKCVNDFSFIDKIKFIPDITINNEFHLYKIYL